MITGLSGTVFTDEEKQFVKANNPWGLILFARNVEDKAQVKTLTDEFKNLVGRQNAPVLIDQEGGRVRRMRPPVWQDYYSGERLAAIWQADKTAGNKAIFLQSRLMAHDLREVGINVDCLPVLDVPVEGGHDVIGDRAYSKVPQEVADMGRIASDGLLQGGVLPVIKHIPGHGRAAADSHLELPTVDASETELFENDFVPFKALRDIPLAMTAHVRYLALDSENCATLSASIISKIIRKHIGFDGLLMSDDLSMKALKGTFAERTKNCLSAGCDVVLHCNGVMEEMQEIASTCPNLTQLGAKRAQRALLLTEHLDEIDVDAARREFEGLLEPAA